MNLTAVEVLGIWLAVGFTLAIFSFLYRDNPIYRVAEQVYVGVSAGYGLVVTIFDFLLPLFWEPLKNAFLTAIGSPEATSPGSFVVIIPFILGVFIVLRVFRNLTWLSRYSYAVLVGTAAGIVIPQVTDSILIPQVGNTINPLYPWSLNPEYANQGTFWQFIYSPGMDALVTLVGVFSVLMFFFFSVEHRGVVGGIARVGVYVLMITFGASFGYTVMARVSLLIGRMTYLLNPEKGGMVGAAVWQKPTIVLLVLFIVAMILFALSEKKRRPPAEAPAG